jgi:hypothetical protein
MLLLQLRREPLHHHHVAIVHGRDGDRGVRTGGICAGSQEKQRSNCYGSPQATSTIVRDGASPLGWIVPPYAAT